MENENLRVVKKENFVKILSFEMYVKIFNKNPQLFLEKCLKFENFIRI